MFTDIVGFVALTQRDERLALAVLEGHRRMLRPIFPKHHGHEVKTIGDAFLVEFGSALEATECAVEIQRFLNQFNAASHDEWKVRLRIGIHLGDVVQSEGDVIGDTVNLASRLQSVAEPDGICISEQVFAQVRNKVSFDFERVDVPSLKNVRFPLGVYRLIWNRGNPAQMPSPSNVPRIAVLPFVNISPDPKDEYFADGLTEELITEIAKLGELRVIARTSVNRYRGTKLGMSEIGRELGVGTVLEGSVRRADNRIRITAQLIDVSTEEHRWAATYDRTLENIFEIQSDISRQVAQTLKLQMEKPRGARTRPAVRSDSYLACLRGRGLMHARTRNGLEHAKEQFEKAIELDRSNAQAYAGLADATYLLYVYNGQGTDVQRRVEDYLAKALELDPELSEAHASLGGVRANRFDFAGAEVEYKRAIALNPSYVTAHHWYALWFEHLGRPQEAFGEWALAEEADPLSAVVLFGQAQLLVWVGRVEEARERVARLGEVAGESALFHSARYLLANLLGETAAQLRELDWFRAHEDGPLDRLMDDFMQFHILKDEEHALHAIDEIVALDYDPILKARILMFACARWGRLEDCFRYMEQCAGAGMLELRNFRLDPDMSVVRNDPRFPAMMRRLGVPGF
jgi:adenylate cyclase